MAKVNFKIEGMDKLFKGFEQLGDVPQKHVTSAVKKSMNPILKSARAKTPYLTGDLEKGIILKGEKAVKRGKKVYRIVFDPAMNHIFQKPNADGKITGYYPVSQEYGFFAKDGKYIPGLAFVSDTFRSSVGSFEKDVIKTMQEKIDNELRKAGWL